MPKTKRDKLKGSIAKAVLSVYNASQQVQYVIDAFQEQHPELIGSLDIAKVYLFETFKNLCQFYRDAWGELPDDWHATRQRK